MKILKIKSLIVLFVAIISVNVSNVYAQNYDQRYADGIEKLRNKNWPEALNIWMELASELEDKNIANPRLGVSLIDLITDRKLRHFYQEATRYYYNGFNNFDVSKFGEFILEESTRITPLLKKNQKDVWKDAAKNDIKLLSTKIKEYWIDSDPTPVTLVNERLLEHWERINFARKNYVRTRNSQYRTDDRGIVYIRYGKPDKIHRGTLGDNEKEIAYWIQNISARRELNLLYNSYPEYEIWAYYNHSIYDSNLFIFGQARERPFGLYSSIEDFIPNRAFSRRNQFGKNAVPGVFFQLSFYDRLIPVDKRFSDRYAEISGMMNSGRRNNVNTLRGIRTRLQNEDKNDPVKKNAPAETSVFDSVIPVMEIRGSAIRTLSNENKPMLSAIAISYPTFKKPYTVNHTLVTRDNDYNELSRVTDEIKDGAENISTFIIEHKENAENVIIAAQSRLAEKDTVNLMANYPSAGSIIIKNHPPLSTDLTKLEISDMVYGIDFSEDQNKANFPFPVLPTNTISKGDPLRVYIEVYNLMLGSVQGSNFTINYQVEKTGKKGIIEKLRGQQNKNIISQLVNFTSTTRSSKETTSFDVGELEVGEYEFLVEVTDTISGQSKFRLGTFRIIN